MEFTWRKHAGTFLTTACSVDKPVSAELKFYFFFLAVLGLIRRKSVQNGFTSRIKQAVVEEIKGQRRPELWDWVGMIPPASPHLSLLGSGVR